MTRWERRLKARAEGREMPPRELPDDELERKLEAWFRRFGMRAPTYVDIPSMWDALAGSGYMAKSSSDYYRYERSRDAKRRHRI